MRKYAVNLYEPQIIELSMLVSNNREKIAKRLQNESDRENQNYLQRKIDLLNAILCAIDNTLNKNIVK